MSVVTKTGDKGATGLMYNRRVEKNHPRVEAYGCVDELNAALGMARAATRHDFIAGRVLAVQKQLVILMGELATLPEDLERYRKDGYSQVTAEMTGQLEEGVKAIEAQKVSFSGWATPGATADAAALDLARTICRRAERRICDLETVNPEILVFLNRLSDLLWLMARWAESA
jgi:cob(I)alamin adenosyltransferase